MYQLLINTAYDTPDSPTWRQADTGNDTIAITYQANNIAELKSRQANRSNTITLPRTANNDRIFGLPGEPSSRSRSPYHYLDARLYHNGVELFGAGSKLRVIEANSDGYKVAIYASLFDLFAQLKDRKLREMSLGCVAWDTPAIAKGLASSVILTDEDGEPLYDSNGKFEAVPADYVSFPLVDWDANDPSLSFALNEALLNQPDPEEGEEPTYSYGLNTVTIRSQYILPAVKFSWLCEQVLKEHKYTLKLPAELATDLRYQNAVVPLTRMQPSRHDRKAAIDGKVVSIVNGDGWCPFTTREGLFTELHKDRVTDPMFRAIASGTYTFTVTITGSGGTGKYADFRLRQGLEGDDDEEYTVLYSANSGSIAISEAVVVELKQYEAAWFTIRGWQVSKATVTICCTDVKLDGPVFPSEALPIAPNLPDLSQSDLLTTLCQLWCLVPVANDRDRELEFFSYDTLYANLQQGVVKDWSGKLDDLRHRTSFRWNSFAQTNVIKYKEDEGREGDGGTREKVTSEDSFTIADGTLDLTKNLFELPFYACEEAPLARRSDVSVAKIRAIAQGDTQNMSEAKPKLLYLKRSEEEPQLSEWVWKFNNQLYNSNIDVLFFYYATFSELEMSNFQECYATLTYGLLKDTRLVVEKLWLTPNDLVDFDHSIPVYLSKYNCCFYVNKVSNFTPGKLTDVELVAIRSLET